MSQWVERITGHPVFAELDSLDGLLTATREIAQEEANTTDAWDRISRITAYCRHILGRIDPLLASPAQLNNIASSLQQISKELTAYNSNRNPGHLTNANTHADNSLLIHLGQLPLVVAQCDVDDLREAASNYRRSVGQLTRNLQDEIATATSAATDLAEATSS